MEIIIDLNDCDDKQSVLLRIGEILMLGGPNGNIPIEPGTAEKGWGINWDALYDSLRELENGGIWGTSPKLQFPITLIFQKSTQFKSNNPKDYQVLIEILDDVKSYYSQAEKVFEYKFI
jgi:hypothetical protein